MKINNNVLIVVLRLAVMRKYQKVFLKNISQKIFNKKYKIFSDYKNKIEMSLLYRMKSEIRKNKCYL